MKTICLAIFASGAGSNAARLIEYFSDNNDVKVCLVLTNKQQAGVLKIAEKHSIAAVIVTKDEFYDFNSVQGILQKHGVDYIILAGFLMKVSDDLVKAYAGKMINIHPALLPKFGGAGMYGNHVHAAVKASEEKESGITIHLVNEHYDEGEILFQAKCELAPDNTVADIRAKVQALEHEFFPQVIAKYIANER